MLQPPARSNKRAMEEKPRRTQDENKVGTEQWGETAAKDGRGRMGCGGGRQREDGAENDGRDKDDLSLWNRNAHMHHNRLRLGRRGTGPCQHELIRDLVEAVGSMAFEGKLGRTIMCRYCSTSRPQALEDYVGVWQLGVAPRAHRDPLRRRSERLQRTREEGETKTGATDSGAHPAVQGTPKRTLAP